MTLAGRRSRDRPGPDGAPRRDPLDVRWGSAYAYIVTSYPDTRPWLWDLLSEVYDQGQRGGRTHLNPFWREDPGDLPSLRTHPPHSRSLAGVRRRDLRPVLPEPTRRDGERPGEQGLGRPRSVNAEHPSQTPIGRVAGLPPLGETPPMNDALAVMPPKVRAWIYLLLIVANAVITPLMAAGVIPSLYGTSSWRCSACSVARPPSPTSTRRRRLCSTPRCTTRSTTKSLSGEPARRSAPRSSAYSSASSSPSCVAPKADARPAPEGATVTVWDQSGGVLPARAAGNAWAKSGAVNVKMGTCTGPSCIVVRSTVTHAEGTCFASTAGCAYKIPDGTCIVEVNTWVSDRNRYQSRYLAQSVTTHELGHCLGVPHLEPLDSIMHNPGSSTDPIRTPSAGDLQYLRDVSTGRIAAFDPGTLY